MQTLFYSGWDTLEIAERAQPHIAPDEVLLRVAACGICGSELESFKNKSPRRLPPLVMGHEFCGVIEAMGEDVTGYETGQQVVSNSLISCGECVRCKRGDTHLCAHRQLFGMHRAGAFAEFVAVPARALLHWPASLAPEVACLAEPLANGVHVVNLTKHIVPQTVLVIGAGPIGLMALGAFRAMAGARVGVADFSDERLAAARYMGVAHVWNARATDVVAATREWTGGEGADVVIDAVGAAATKKQAIEAARVGGAAVWIGLHENAMSFDSYEVTLPEKQVLGSYAAKQEELETALHLLEEGRINTQGWVQKLPLASGVEAFERALAARGNDIKIVVSP